MREETAKTKMLSERTKKCTQGNNGVEMKEKQG